jgi:hypothetical protein
MNDEVIPDEPTLSRNKQGIVPTLLRSLLLQNHNLNAFGVQSADLVIEPDVTGFDPAAFMKAMELTAIGEAAALEQIAWNKWPGRHQSDARPLRLLCKTFPGPPAAQ